MTATMLASILLFLFLVFPMVLRLLYVKAALLGILLVWAIARALGTGRLRVSRSVMGWTLVLAAASMTFGLLGLLRGAPGAFKQLQIYAFWPLVYTLLLTGATRPLLRKLHATVVWSSLFLSVYGLHFTLSAAGIVPSLPYLEWLSFGETLGIGLHQGFVEVLFPGLNSLPYLLPFLIASLLVRAGEHARPGMRVHWAAFGALVALGLVSGRRAVFVVVAIAPLVALAVAGGGVPALRSTVRRRSLMVAGVGVLLLLAIEAAARTVYQFSLARLFTDFLVGFDFETGSEAGAYFRRQQYDVLLAQWLESPWLGAGHGASAVGLVRSAEVPWSYELYYLALLFQVGLVGVALYAAGIAWIVWEGWRMLRERPDTAALLVPAMTGLLCFLIASATNPYLARFDAIWIVFWPLAIVNVVRTGRWDEIPPETS